MLDRRVRESSLSGVPDVGTGSDARRKGKYRSVSDSLRYRTVHLRLTHTYQGKQGARYAAAVRIPDTSSHISRARSSSSMWLNKVRKGDHMLLSQSTDDSSDVRWRTSILTRQRVTCLNLKYPMMLLQVVLKTRKNRSRWQSSIQDVFCFCFFVLFLCLWLLSMTYVLVLFHCGLRQKRRGNIALITTLTVLDCLYSGCNICRRTLVRKAHTTENPSTSCNVFQLAPLRYLSPTTLSILLQPWMGESDKTLHQWVTN